MTINFNSESLDVIVKDESYRYRRIMAENVVYLQFALPTHVEIPIGATIEYEGLTYTLETPAKVTKNHNRSFDYVLDFESPTARLTRYKVRNMVDGRLKFPLTATPLEHLTLLRDNLNSRESGWSIGDCISSIPKLVSYSHDFISDGIIKVAAAFQTEFEIIGKVLHLRKVEHAKNNPLPLSYGKGNGLLSGTGRANFGEGNAIEILYIQGGERNIDRSVYGSSELLLPKNKTIKYDGSFFEGEGGYNSGNAREYTTDPNGLYIRRNDKVLTHHTEDSLDLPNIYPQRVGVVTSVYAVNPAKNLYDFVDNTIPAGLDYNDSLIVGQTPTVYFESGMLAGRTFDISKYTHATRRFQIVPAALDGLDMPNPTFKPNNGDSYAIYGVMLPSSYIQDDSNQSGASWDMFKQGVKYFYDNEEQKFTITGEVDSIWSSKNWLAIGGRLGLGYYVRYSDAQFLPNGVDIRIVGIKDYLNNPQKPKIELSNNAVTGGVSSTIKKLDATEVVIEATAKMGNEFTKRRYRDAVETMKLIELTMSDYFTDAINPAAVHTMSLLVGAETLQFRFVDNKIAPEEITHTVSYNNGSKVLFSPAGIIQHMTLGITDISSSHKVAEYSFWDIPDFTSPPLTDPTKAYWLYAKVEKSGSSGEFILNDAPLNFETGSHYNLWVGVLNTEYLEERSYVDLYGFTEILPGRITTKRVVSEDGLNWFDFVANSFRIGNETVMLDFNGFADGLLRIKGGIVQSPSGAEDIIPVYIGIFDSDRFYFQGETVDFTDLDGRKGRYRYINATSTKGNLPSDPAYWKADTEDGRRGGAIVYRGVYQPDVTYTGNFARIDVVKYGSMWYEARATAGDFTGVTPTAVGNEKWKYFGASFSSVATDLLLSDKARIGDWWLEGGKIVSRLEDNLDPSNDIIAKMTLDATLPEIKMTKNGRDINETSLFNTDGLMINSGKLDLVSYAVGMSAKGAISGRASAALNQSVLGANYVAGVFGSAFNSGTAPSYGGYFIDLMANGLYLSGSVHSAAFTVSQYETLITLTGGAYTISLPSVIQENNIKIFKNISTATKTIYPGTGQKMFEGNSENASAIIANKSMIIAYSKMLNVGGTNYMCWIVTRL